MHLTMVEPNRSGLSCGLSSPRIETTRRRLNSISQNCMRVEYITEAKVQKEIIFLSNDARDIVIQFNLQC